MAKKRERHVFSPGKARWLLEHIDQLDDDQRALLLAITELDKDMGRKLTEEERAAVEKLAAETQGFSPVEIQDAVQKMVEGKTTHKNDHNWTDVSRRLKKAAKK
jgi:Uri superfamily endonuclease